MKRAIKLLKGRKAAANLELSYADPNNPEHTKTIKDKREEIAELEQALLVLLNVVKSFKDKKAPTFDEFITNFGLEKDIDNEYFFDNEYYTFEGLYYKYAEYFKLKP